MDIQKIINEKVVALVETGDMQKKIEDSIENTVKKSIEDLLGGYSFRNDIESKLKEHIDPCLKDLDLSVYGQLVTERLSAVVHDVMGKDLGDKVDKFYNDLFNFKNSKEPIELSYILEKVREYFAEEVRDSSYNDEETMQLKIEKNSSYDWWEIAFQREELSSYSSSKRDYENQVTLSKNRQKTIIKNSKGEDEEIETYYMLSVDLGRIKFNFQDKTISHIGGLSSFETLILNAYFNQTPIILDVTSEHEVETYIGEEY